MSGVRRLVGLYPGAVRERWGADLEIELRTTGWRAVPSLLAGVADMWLHPAIWPADSPAQRRGRAAALAVVVATACWFLGHAVAELASPPVAGAARSWPVSGGADLTLCGLALVAPRPRPTSAVIGRLVRRATRLLAVPVLLGAAVVTVVHAGAYAAAPALLRPVLLGCWWSALGLCAIQGCRIVAGLGGAEAEPPAPARLRLGLLTLTAAGVLPAPVLLSAAVKGGRLDLFPAVAGVGLLLLPAALVATLRDLRGLHRS